MLVFATVFAVFLLAVAAMSLGVVFAGKKITGSCGGLSNLGEGETCSICGASADAALRARVSPRGGSGVGG